MPWRDAGHHLLQRAVRLPSIVLFSSHFASTGAEVFPANVVMLANLGPT
jgi:hypothetical protein